MSPKLSAETSSSSPSSTDSAQATWTNAIPKRSDALTQMRLISVASIRDTFSARRHSKDFSYARSSYLRNRVLIIGIIFLILMPVWTAIDIVVLPEAAQANVLPARVVMVVGLLLAVMLAYWLPHHVALLRLSAGLIFILPAAFYVVVLASLNSLDNTSLIGYSFIPYMLTAMLAIFPLTLLEGLLAGVFLLAVEAYALIVAGTLYSAAGLQALWLLAALLVITITAIYFHLGLLLRLYREATHDPLTGLMNRAAFIHNAQQLIMTRTGQPLALLMLDLDHFKRVNDEHGHSIGDRVLQEFARILRKNVRRSDFVARYGGEEFVIVLVGAGQDDAKRIAENIRAQTEAARLSNHDGGAVHVTVSIGVSVIRPNEQFDEALRRADERLYEGKKSSRNCVIGV